MTSITRRYFFAIAALFASLFFTSASFAQNTPMSAELRAAVQAAAEAGDGEAVAALAEANPDSIAQIAQLAIQVASTITTSNPTGAVAVAAAVVQIASTPAFQNAAPAVAANVAVAAAQIASAPAVLAAAPAVAVQVANAATVIVNTPVVAAAAPTAVAAVARLVAQVPGANPAPAGPSNQNPGDTTQNQPVDVVSPVSKSS